MPLCYDNNSSYNSNTAPSHTYLTITHQISVNFCKSSVNSKLLTLHFPVTGAYKMIMMNVVRLQIHINLIWCQNQNSFASQEDTDLCQQICNPDECGILKRRRHVLSGLLRFDPGTGSRSDDSARLKGARQTHSASLCRYLILLTVNLLRCRQMRLRFLSAFSGLQSFLKPSEKNQKKKKTMFVLAKIGLEQKGRMKASHRLCSCNFSATAVILYSSRVFQKWQWLLLSYSRMLQFPAVTIIRSRGKRWQEFTCAWGCTQILE